MWIDSQGLMYVSDNGNAMIRNLDSNNILTTYMGGGTNNGVVSGNGGPVSSAHGFPTNLCGDSAGSLYVLESSNQVARRVDTTTGIIYAFAGMGTSGGSTDEGIAATQADIYVLSCSTDTNGDFYFADWFHNRVRKVTATSGIINTVLGTGVGASSVYSYFEDTSIDGDNGMATSANIILPSSVFIDSVNHMYIGELHGKSVRKVDLTTNIVTLVAGTGIFGFTGDGGPATSATLRGNGVHLTADLHGNVFYVDYIYSNIRHIDTHSGYIYRFAGNKFGYYGYSGDGGDATSALLSYPAGPVVYNGILYFCDSTNNVVRAITYHGPPTTSPTIAPTYDVVPPSQLPTIMPTVAPTIAPTLVPTIQPTVKPTVTPSLAPTLPPTIQPSVVPTVFPTIAPTVTPTVQPSMSPTLQPTLAPTVQPSVIPTVAPSIMPSVTPTVAPTVVPTIKPTVTPTIVPTIAPSVVPTVTPTLAPTVAPTEVPTIAPTEMPTIAPSIEPTVHPTIRPTRCPSIRPTRTPTVRPSMEPSEKPSVVPTESPSEVPSERPSDAPTVAPTTRVPTQRPSRGPTAGPTVHVDPTDAPTAAPTLDFVDISFDTDIYLHNVTADSLDETCQDAVVSAVAVTLDLDEDQVTYLSQRLIGTEGGRRLTDAEVYQIAVTVNVWASTRDFEDAANQDGDYLYERLSTVLDEAVNSNDFTQTVRETSAAVGAVATRYVGHVNLTRTDYEVVTVPVSVGVVDETNHENDDFSRGDFAGVVIGVIVSFLMLVGCCYYFFVLRGERSDDAFTSHDAVTPGQQQV